MYKNLLTEGIQAGVVQTTELTKKLTIDGETKTYPVYKIRLDALYYNDKNDRIATWISEYKAEHDINLSETEENNEIIENFIIQSNETAIFKTKKNIELFGQQEPGVVLCDGRVIDGNRRFTCLRLSHKENILNTNWFEAVILPDNISNDGRSIKALELALQHGVDSKVDYNPIDRLVGIYNDIIINKTFTVAEYAQITNDTESEIRKKVALAQLMAEYLKFIGAPEKFYIARKQELDGPLNEMYGALKRHSPETLEYKRLKKILFLHLSQKPSGDMTRYIRDIKSKIVGSSFEEEFIAEQMPMVEAFIEKNIDLESDVPDPEKRIILIREKTPSIVETIAKGKNKYVEKTNRETLQNQPLDLLQKSMECMESIDLNILPKLAQPQLISIQQQISTIQDKLSEISTALDALL